MNYPSKDANEPILRKLHAYRWTSRLLTAAALGIGILAIAGGIIVNLGSTKVMFPQMQLLLKESNAAHAGDTNTVASLNATNRILTLGDGSKVDQQVLVTLLQAKIMNVTSLALTLLGLGTMLTLLLVIFNRRVTLRQVNTSLAQISQQIKELQNRQDPR